MHCKRKDFVRDKHSLVIYTVKYEVGFSILSLSEVHFSIMNDVLKFDLIESPSSSFNGFCVLMSWNRILTNCSTCVHEYIRKEVGLPQSGQYIRHLDSSQALCIILKCI
uniref:Uncharacterized protein n=1 Tax=Clytia hemisphaerica TaxID=252671 RepID=A0A7M5VGG8_9CNID